MNLLEKTDRPLLDSKRGQVRRILKDRILMETPGCRLPSTDVLARHFSICYITMQSALSDLVREGLLVRHRGKGTFVADRKRATPRSTSSRMVLIFPPQKDIQSAGNAELVLRLCRGSSEGATERGGQLLMEAASSEPDPGEIRTLLGRLRQYDGVLVYGDQYRQVVEALAEEKFPVVTVGTTYPNPASVVFDRKAAVKLAVEHLLGHGYDRIGFFGAPDGPYSTLPLFDNFLRVKGPKACACVVEPCPTPDQASDAAERFLNHSPLPRAVFSDNELKTACLLRSARKRGIRVPEDLAVLNFSIPLEGDFPSPTTVEIPYLEMGREGVLLLDRIITGRTTQPIQRLVAPRLVIHESCGCKSNVSIDAIKLIGK